MREFKAVSREYLADLDTPVSAYLKLCQGQAHSFLLESGESVDQIGRYSIVTWDPLWRIYLTPDDAHLVRDGEDQAHPAGDFFRLAGQMQQEFVCPDMPDLPFVGSLVGMVGYDAVRLIERLPPAKKQDLPVADLSLCSRVVIFDHLLRKMTMVVLDQDGAVANAKLDEMEARLKTPVVVTPGRATLEMIAPPAERFMEAVKKAREYILAGDIFQVVLSDQFKGKSDMEPFAAYRALRTTNPSPYMFFLDLGDYQLAGASPETLVTMHGDHLRVRPIAGTRGRSADPEIDNSLETELMASEKERAEHVMLVDLARNDAGRVCSYGSIRVDPYMVVERYSHVMHIVSQVTGALRPEIDVWDAFQAAFPAGTVSGAPKVRAMEIIDELETLPRGPYAGAVGRFGPGRQMDTCIAIRMIQFQGGEITVQAGAGIVADSDPGMEYEEITNKAAQGIAALRTAAEGGL